MMRMNDEEETTHTTTKCIKDEMMNTSEEKQTAP